MVLKYHLTEDGCNPNIEIKPLVRRNHPAEGSPSCRQYSTAAGARMIPGSGAANALAEAVDIGPTNPTSHYSSILAL